MISTHSSGSSPSARAVELKTSQKSTLTTRRSPSTEAPLSVLRRAASSLASNASGTYWRRRPREVSPASPCAAWPQFGQNFAATGNASPQFSHLARSGAPHWMQNLAAESLAVWQRGHFMCLNALSGARRRGYTRDSLARHPLRFASGTCGGGCVEDPAEGPAFFRGAIFCGAEQGCRRPAAHATKHVGLGGL